MNKSGGIPGGLGVLHPPICRQVYPVKFSPTQSNTDGSVQTSSDSQLYKSFLDRPFFCKKSQSQHSTTTADDIDEMNSSTSLEDTPNVDSKVRYIRPAAQKQLASVKLLLSNFMHTNASVEKDKLFFLDSDWFSSWYEYVSASQTNKTISEPGTIDNLAIEAGEFVDAVALPEYVWVALVSWYSGGPPINQLSNNKPYQLLTNREVIEKYYPLLLSSPGDDALGISPAKSKESPAPSPSTFCFMCHAKSSMRCSKCSLVFYCGKECQGIHWKLQHKSLCGKGPGSGSGYQQVGLFNLGNSCYMSSSLQCLAHVRPLTRYFLSQRHAKDLNRESKYGTAGRLVDQYVKLLEDMCFGYSGKVISPRAFKVALGKVNVDYAGLVQQDAHELVQLLLDKLHEDLNRVRGTKPSTERSEGDGTNDSVLAREQWEKTLLRDDSKVNDVAGSLMRCQHVCPTCNKKTVFYEHQNTVALCIPPPQIQPNQMPTNLVDFKVVYLPEVPQQTRHLSFESLKQLLQPQVWTIKVNQEKFVSALRERIVKLLPAAALKQCNDKIVLVEAANANLSTVQPKFLDDGMPLTSLSPTRLVYCYCPIHIYKKKMLLLQRAVLPSEIAGPRTVEQCIKFSLFGFPQLISYDAEWATARLRLSIWMNQFRLLADGSADELSCQQSFEEKMVIRQLELASQMPLRLISRLGTSKSRLQDTGIDPSMLEGPSAEQGLSKVFDGLDSERIRDLQQLVTDYENCVVGEAKQGDSARETLQRDFDREMGQYVPAEKHLKVAQFEQACLKKDVTLFLAVDWLGGDAMTLVDKSGHYVQSLLPAPSAPLPPATPAAQTYQLPAPISLHDCLKEHTTEEVLDEGNELYCSSCKAHKPVTKVIHFHRDYLPNVLIIILKRFERRQVRSRSRGGSFAGDSLSYMRTMLDNLPQSGVSAGGMRTEKIDDFIDFPLDGLNMDPYCSAGGETGQGAGIYDLFAVCNHYGRAGFGHYTAFCREWQSNDELSEQWYCFDDDHVSKVRPSDVGTKAAYILFYRRRLQRNNAASSGGGLTPSSK